MKRSLSLAVKSVLAMLSSLLAFFGCGGNRDPSAPPAKSKIRWQGEETDYRNITEGEPNRRPDPTTTQTPEETNEK
jgi:hypothetical protein